ACLEGIQLAAEWINKPTIIESDCLTIVKVLHEMGVNRSGITNIVKELKASMTLLLQVRVRKIGRECNRVAYELAQLAKLITNCAVWRMRAPSCVNELLKLDCNPIFD
uniref:RNase H type-1 domain-containing protein n=1 Tax=Setaria italica TaxID=4555 RepID=K3YXT2_SETIT